MATLIACPVELCKIQLQIQAPPGIRFDGPASVGRRFNGPLDVLGQAVRGGGVPAAFQGLRPTLLREVFGYAGQFVAYEVRRAGAPRAVPLCGRGRGFAVRAWAAQLGS